MNDFWLDLEHADAHLFQKEDYLYLLYTVQEGLSKRHGVIEPEFAFYRKEETVLPKKDCINCPQTTKVPRLTVCYIRTAFATFTGLAYCSNEDNPNKFYGRALSFKRAVIALVGREECDENYIREETEFAQFLKKTGAKTETKSFFVEDSEYRLTIKEDSK